MEIIKKIKFWKNEEKIWNNEHTIIALGILIVALLLCFNLFFPDKHKIFTNELNDLAEFNNDVLITVYEGGVAVRQYHGNYRVDAVNNFYTITDQTTGSVVGAFSDHCLILEEPSGIKND